MITVNEGRLELILTETRLINRETVGGLIANSDLRQMKRETNEVPATLFHK